MTDKKLLILVHPGSACGSADFNLGETGAENARSYLEYELDEWRGGFLVIDGDLSEELPYYRNLDISVRGALATSENKGLISGRVQGNDPDQVKVIEKFVNQMDPDELSKTTFIVTGAWYDNDGGGCVGSVHNKLIELGLKSRVSPHAMNLDFDYLKAGKKIYEDDDEYEEESFITKISSERKLRP